MLLKSLFQNTVKDKKILYIEELFNNQHFADHFSFGFKNGDYTAGVIVLNGHDGSKTTEIDGNQTAFIDKDNHELVVFHDKRGAKGKLRFFTRAAHVFEVATPPEEKKKNPEMDLLQKALDDMAGGY